MAAHARQRQKSFLKRLSSFALESDLSFEFIPGNEPFDRVDGGLYKIAAPRIRRLDGRDVRSFWSKTNNPPPARDTFIEGVAGKTAPPEIPSHPHPSVPVIIHPSASSSRWVRRHPPTGGRSPAGTREGVWQNPNPTPWWVGRRRRVPPSTPRRPPHAGGCWPATTHRMDARVEAGARARAGRRPEREEAREEDGASGKLGARRPRDGGVVPRRVRRVSSERCPCWVPSARRRWDCTGDGWRPSPESHGTAIATGCPAAGLREKAATTTTSSG